MILMKTLAVLFVLLVHSSASEILLEIRNEGIKENNFFFVGRNEPSPEFGEYVPMLRFEADGKSPYFVAVEACKVEDGKVHLSILIAKSLPINRVAVWSTSWFVGKENCEKCQIVVSDEDHLKRFDIFADGEKTGFFCVFSRSKTEDFKEISISRASPLWDWDAAPPKI